MIKYQFTEPRRTDELSDGRTRCYYNETVSSETISTKNPDTEENVSETHQVYGYEVIDLEGPVTKAALVNALIRSARLPVQRGGEVKELGPYSQSDVEAIMRHALADAAGAADEFGDFDAFAERCKAEANRILQLG